MQTGKFPSLVVVLCLLGTPSPAKATGTTDATRYLPTQQIPYVQVIEIPANDADSINVSQDGTEVVVGHISGMLDFYTTGPEQLTFKRSANTGAFGLYAVTFCSEGWAGVSGATLLGINMAEGTLVFYDDNGQTLQTVLLPWFNYTSITFNFANNIAYLGTDTGALIMTPGLGLTALGLDYVVSEGYVHLSDEAGYSDLYFDSGTAYSLSEDGQTLGQAVDTFYGDISMRGFVATPDLAATLYDGEIIVWQNEPWQRMISTDYISGVPSAAPSAPVPAPK